MSRLRLVAALLGIAILTPACGSGSEDMADSVPMTGGTGGIANLDDATGGVAGSSGDPIIVTREAGADAIVTREAGADAKIETQPESGATEGGVSYAFDDEFDGTSIDTNLWTIPNQHGDMTNNEAQCYVLENATESGGYLRETVTSQATDCPGSGMASYSSGAVQMRKFNFTYGTVEVRAKLAGGSGPWPAIWLLGADCQYPNWLTNTCPWPNPGSDEIDVAEILNSNHAAVNEQIHSGGNNPGCNGPASPPVDEAFHIYKLVWRAGSLDFWIDGKSTCTLTSSVPSHPMFLIINLAIGGAGGSIDKATLPQTTMIDYVRISTP
jgi:beta-glucanase (GH16 family)